MWFWGGSNLAVAIQKCLSHMDFAPRQCTFHNFHYGPTNKTAYLTADSGSKVSAGCRLVPAFKRLKFVPRLLEPTRHLKRARCIYWSDIFCCWTTRLHDCIRFEFEHIVWRQRASEPIDWLFLSISTHQVDSRLHFELRLLVDFYLLFPLIFEI